LGKGIAINLALGYILEVYSYYPHILSRERQVQRMIKAMGLWDARSRQ
jgi:hypothetical protein